MDSRKLLIAAVLLALLSGGVWWAKRHPETSESKTPAGASPTLVNIPEAAVQSFDIKKKNGATVTAQLAGGKWAITAPASYPADQDAVKSVVSSLGPATADSLVDEKPIDQNRYGLNAPALTVILHEKGGKTDQLMFGDDVPAGSLVYARVNADPKVYAVSTSVKSSLDKTANDLRDKRLLTFDQNQLTRIELASGVSDIEFGKNAQNEWTIIKPQPFRADNFQVDELVRKLADAKMDLSITADESQKASGGFTSGKPAAIAKTTDAAGTQTLEVRKDKDDYYARSSAISGVYKVTPDLGKVLEKSLDDFRNKKIFDFGFNDPTKLQIQQSASDKTFVRNGSDWKVNGQNMDAGAVQSLIDKLRDLTAAKFAAAGFTSPVSAVTVFSNDGKRTEKAEFAKAADGYIARRAGEPALYQLDAKAVNDILEASNAIKPAASNKK